VGVLVVPRRKLWEPGPLSILYNIDQVIDAGQRGIGAVDGRITEIFAHGELGVSLE
jgi:hypothetical protein